MLLRETSKGGGEVIIENFGLVLIAYKWFYSPTLSYGCCYVFVCLLGKKSKYRKYTCLAWFKHFKQLILRICLFSEHSTEKARYAGAAVLSAPG